MNDVSADRGASVFVSFLSLLFLLLVSQKYKKPLGKLNLPVTVIQKKIRLRRGKSRIPCQTGDVKPYLFIY